MKYYVFEVAEGDKSIAGASVGTFDTLDEAIASYHGRLNKAGKSDLYTKDLCTILNSDGGQYQKYTDVVRKTGIESEEE